MLGCNLEIEHDRETEIWLLMQRLKLLLGDTIGDVPLRAIIQILTIDPNACPGFYFSKLCLW